MQNNLHYKQTSYSDLQCTQQKYMEIHIINRVNRVLLLYLENPTLCFCSCIQRQL